jgi:hypothetical protein
LLYALFGLAFAFVGFGAYSIDAVSGLQTFFTPLVDGVVVGLGIIGGLANVAIRRKAAPVPAPGS